MPATETIKVWRYNAPGASPLPLHVNPNSQPDAGRWRGETVCGSEACGSWVSDIDPENLASSLPLSCPTCQARNGYPELLWREIVLECYFCGGDVCCQVIDPSDAWPKEVDCPECETTIAVPVIGSALVH